ncbi:circadian clock KaiB family protein [Accumulibacter sp.]|uniref:circadian clock KaiB family protein n=1 Tax=Accumulibacter sp. TaxID=2053492 RepID=UPI0028C45707|nr:circadian clock KaiB family protein [Accumulibacter sp.]
MRKLQLTLYVAGVNDEIRQQVATLGRTMDAEVGTGHWVLDVVDVLEEPEKALQGDVFATPTLVRIVPLPVLKLLGGIAQSEKILSIIASDGTSGDGG